MKKVCLEELPAEVQAVFEGVESGRVLITRGGVPFAVVASVGNQDEEDLDLEESPEFWEMIRERRRERATVPWEQVMADLAGEEQGPKNPGNDGEPSVG